MSVTIIANASIEASLPEEVLRPEMCREVRGRIECLGFRYYEGLRMALTLVTVVYLGDQVPGRHGTEQAVAGDVIRAAHRLAPGCTVEVTAVIVDDGDWCRVEAGAGAHKASE
jgi:hypothetical protein